MYWEPGKLLMTYDTTNRDFAVQVGFAPMKRQTDRLLPSELTLEFAL